MRYPTPDTINPKGTLANVLDHEEIVFGYVNTTIEYVIVVVGVLLSLLWAFIAFVFHNSDFIPFRAPHVDSHHPYIVLDTTHPQVRELKREKENERNRKRERE